MRFPAVFYTLLLASLSLNTAQADEHLKRVIADDKIRSNGDIARDIYRHPYETLSFFGIKQDMTVAEVQPGGGWYTRILAPYLRENGSYIAVNYSPTLMRDARRRQNYENWGRTFTSNTAFFGDSAQTAFMGGPEPLAEEGSIDLILTTREWHNWTVSGLTNTLAHAFFRALKPGGVLGVVQHRAKEDTPIRPNQNTGYVKESYLIDVLTSAGFKLEAKSDINANPKDSANWPRGVWTLPPTLALREENRDYYLSIGESDRMTLKFVKPDP